MSNVAHISTNVISFPDRSSEDESFAEFWESCKETGQEIDYGRAVRLFHATPEKYFSRAGWVYVLGNQHLAENVYKIGLTTGRIERRMRQLYTTGVPGEFDCVHADWFSDCHHAEAFIHEWLSEFRIEEGREFFMTDLKTIDLAFMNYHAIGDPCPSHMVEQMLRRQRFASQSEIVKGVPLSWPTVLEMEVPF